MAARAWVFDIALEETRQLGGVTDQYVTDPGYNRDRGPAFVLGGRLRVA
jgi:hypothetical protein